MSRFTFISVLAFLTALTLVAGFSLFGPHVTSVQVTVHVTFEGAAADAMIVAMQSGKPVDVEYTDVHAPGDYTLSIEHGAGYLTQPLARQISVKPNAPVEVDAPLARALDPRIWNYYSADLHLHTQASAEPMERIFFIKNHGITPVGQAVGVELAAGLDLLFISDHNTTAGRAVFAQTADERGAPFLVGEEITTVRWGHFNVYPLDAGQTVEFDFSKNPKQFFTESRAKGASIIQINHPFDSIGGYFFTRNDPGFDPNFDAVEVFNGPLSSDDVQTMQTLFDYWNQGKHYAATASSDDHDWKELVVRYGTPRTYVFVEGDLSAESFVNALKGGHAFVTYGPLINLTASGNARPGDTVTLQQGDQITLTAELQSLVPLKKAELIREGHVMQSLDLSNAPSTISFTDQPDTDGWYALRLNGEQGVLALTNPIWVKVNP